MTKVGKRFQFCSDLQDLNEDVVFTKIIVFDWLVKIKYKHQAFD